MSISNIKKPDINLFIVGAAKSGTTSLYEYLSHHPSVFFPLVKEPNYYSRAESHNSSAYNKPKAGESYHNKIITDESVYFELYEKATGFQVIGDASPSYLWDELSASRIHKDYPEAKILIILRNPVDRAYSHYLMDLASGVQRDRDFMSALAFDNAKEERQWGRAHLYQDLGLYSAQVSRYMRLFGRSNVKVIMYEEFIDDTQRNIKNIFDFIGVDSGISREIDFGLVHNPYRISRHGAGMFLFMKLKFGFLRHLLPSRIRRELSQKILYKKSTKPKLNTSERDQLKKFYMEDILELETILGRELFEWK